jgi:hypothetical protein
MQICENAMYDWRSEKVLYYSGSGTERNYNYLGVGTSSLKLKFCNYPNVIGKLHLQNNSRKRSAAVGMGTNSDKPD